MTEEYAATLGELRDVIEDAIKWYGKDTPYVLVGCYSAEGLVEKEYMREDEAPGTGYTGERRIRLFTDLCSG